MPNVRLALRDLKVAIITKPIINLRLANIN